MTGVEILNTVYEYGRLISPVWFVSFGAVTLLICILGLCTVSFDKVQTVLKILVTISIVGFVGCIIGMAIETDEIIDTKYQVTISEDVNFVEFMDKYEIIDQKGKIYTIKERD